MNRIHLLVGASVVWLGMAIGQTFVRTPKKRIAKINAQDCCQAILDENKSFARIGQYTSQIQAIECTWVQEVLDDDNNGIFAHASQLQLQKNLQLQQKLNSFLEEYEKLLKEKRDYLLQLEQEIRMVKK